ncbi:GNAT family N-acetyltransferase [Niabella hibiscisoli]|uniref:GNAT family N-acetyltransferase n=1 Tax=Niabella hibiscisoli TaxID=1825928 RepID=UPI001F0E7FF8|nr:GNAT family N-acetyltransferase [Niabella hibiscisoli]MCH5718799.1 GNAT family N-acetyltransferase [Niabella hibiscisoli]
MDIRTVPLPEVWSLRHSVMYPDYSADVVKLEDDEQGMHLGIYKAGELVSVVSVFLQEREIQFRKIATRKDWQGKGLATTLLNYINHLAQQKKSTKALV